MLENVDMRQSTNKHPIMSKFFMSRETFEEVYKFMESDTVGIPYESRYKVIFYTDMFATRNSFRLPYSINFQK